MRHDTIERARKEMCGDTKTKLYSGNATNACALTTKYNFAFGGESPNVTYLQIEVYSPKIKAAHHRGLRATLAREKNLINRVEIPS
jgi:hypothetical protein